MNGEESRSVPLPPGSGLDIPPKVLQAPRSSKIGKFVRVSMLGSGGMGEVWKAWDLDLNRWVALKFFRGENWNDLARFKREAQMAGKLSHPNIASIYEMGEFEGQHYIAMQFVEGETLFAFTRQDPRMLVGWMRDVGRAIHFAHEVGIIHRDLKPDNIMVHRGKRGNQLFVMDFGLARPIQKPSDVSLAGVILGTPAYMSPEQARGESVDATADVYSAGATLFEILTGERVFGDPTLFGLIQKIWDEAPRRPSSVNPAIDRDLDAIILKCLEKDPTCRYRSAEEFADDLGRWLEGREVAARPMSGGEKLRKLISRRRMGIGVAAALVGMVALLGFALSKKSGEAEARNRTDTRKADAERDARERARVSLESGRRILEQMRLRMRDRGYSRDDLKTLLAEAKKEFGKALELDPKSAEAHVGIGRAEALASYEDEALAAYQKAIAIAPSFTPAYLARLHINAEEYEQVRHDKDSKPGDADLALQAKCESDLAVVKKHSADNTEIKFAEGLLAFASADYELAQKLLGEYLAIAPGDAKGHYFRAHALYHLKRFDESIVESTRAIDCNTRYHKAYNNRGICKRNRGDSKGAIADFDMGIRFSSKAGYIYKNRANCRKDLGEHEEALEDYTKAIQYMPEDSGLLNTRGVVHLRMDNLDKALADFNACLKMNPRDTNALNNRGIVSYRREDWLAASEDYSAALKIDPNYALAHYGRGRVFVKTGNLDAALEDFSQAIRLNPRDEDAYYSRGNIYRSKNDIELAAADFRKALQVAPADWSLRAKVEELVKRMSP